MTAENRWLFDFDDIQQIHFVCLKCKATLTVPPRRIRRVPPVCVNCNEQLYATSEEQQTLQRFADALDALAAFKTDRFKIRFEFASPHTQSVSGS